MRIVTLAMVGGLLLSGTSPVFAQDAETDAAATDGAAADGATADGESASGDAAEAAGGSGQSYSTEEGRFPVRRGLFVEADLGMFMSFGGRNTNDPTRTFPSKGVSNLQPQVGMFVGYDVFSNDSMNFAAGLKGGLLANGGAGQVASGDLMGANGDPSTFSNDFEMWELGLSGAADFYVHDRIAITGKLGGGLIIYNPSPFEAANVVGGDVDDAISGFPDAGKAAFGGFASVSIGAIINTRLPGFTFGIHNRFLFFFGGKFFMGYAPEFALKYNF